MLGYLNKYIYIYTVPERLVKKKNIYIYTPSNFGIYIYIYLNNIYIHSLKLRVRPQKNGILPQGNNRIPTIHFQGLLPLVSGRVLPTLVGAFHPAPSDDSGKCF